MSVEQFQETIHRACKRDPEAFTVIFFRFKQPIFTFLARRTQDSIASEELTQDVFMKAWMHLPNIVTPLTPKGLHAWLYKIATNAFLDWIKRKNRISFTPLDSEDLPVYSILDETAHPEKDILQIEEKSRVLMVLALLTPSHRNVLVLREYQGFSYAEIAQELHMTIGTIKTSLFRARSEFRKRYLQMYPSEH